MVGVTDKPTILDRLQLGDHVCVRASSADEQHVSAIAYVAGGLREGHRPLLLVDDPGGLREHLLARLPAADAALTRGQVEIRPGAASYCAAGGFESARMLDAVAAEIDQAQRWGYAGLRILAGVAPTGDHNEALLDYEARVNALCVNQPVIGLCHYNPGALDRVTWQKLSQAHTSTVESVDAVDGSTWLRCRRTADGVRLTGEADLTNRTALAGLLAGLAGCQGVCRIDATDLRFADNPAAMCLLRVAESRPTQATVIVCTPHLAKLLALLGAATVPGLEITVAEER